VAALQGLPGEAFADDWLIAPFLGGALGSQTTLIDLERSPRATRLLFGVSGLWLTDGIIGIEGSVAHSPGFFERSNTLLVGSYLTAYTGNVVLAVPLAISRESLRPYAIIGLGSAHASLEDVIGLFTQSRNMAVWTVGGGAMGFLTRRTGVRFDIRQIQALDRVVSPLTGLSETPLSFWQASVAVVLRY
jgi:hypothetical protein